MPRLLVFILSQGMQYGHIRKINIARVAVQFNHLWDPIDSKEVLVNALPQVSPVVPAVSC